MGWTALVPLKPRAERKTRLAASLSDSERERLGDRLATHVLQVLQESPDITAIMILSHECPRGWIGLWLNDGGHGLNTEIASATHTLGDTRVAVIHGDLPFLTVDDVSALLASGENGYGIAPDRHGSGTNAMALRDACGFSFGFGQNSFHYHSAQAKGRAQIIRRHGLAFDIDTADDLADAVAAGWRQHR